MSKDERPTAVVVGAGVIGVCTSYFLSKTHKVTVVDARANATSGVRYCSFRNGGLLCPSLGAPWVSPKMTVKLATSFFDEDSPLRLRWSGVDRNFVLFGFHAMQKMAESSVSDKHNSLSALAKLSMSEFTHVLPHANADNTAKATVQLTQSTPTWDVNAMNAPTDADRFHTVKYEQISPDRVHSMFPAMSNRMSFKGALIGHGDSSGDVHKFTLYLANQARLRGVSFQYNKEVSRVNTSGDGFVDSLEFTDGTKLTADKFVVCAGHESRDLLRRVGVNIPIIPVRGYALHIPLKIRLDANICDDVNKLYLSPLGNTLSLSSRAEIAGTDYSIDNNTVNKLLNKIECLLAEGAIDRNKAKAHVCLRPISPDDMPMIGQCPGFSNLFVNAGHGSKGWTQSMGAGLVLSKVMNGQRAPIDIKPFDPARFALPSRLVRFLFPSQE